MYILDFIQGLLCVFALFLSPAQQRKERRAEIAKRIPTKGKTKEQWQARNADLNARLSYYQSLQQHIADITRSEMGEAKRAAGEQSVPASGVASLRAGNEGRTVSNDVQSGAESTTAQGEESTAGIGSSTSAAESQIESEDGNENHFEDNIEMVARLTNEVSKEALTDNQGNPVDENGKLIVEEVQSIEEITDEDFENPTRNVLLPAIPENVAIAIGTEGKTIVIKKNVFEKNGNTHVELEPEDSRNILRSALYNPNIVGSTQPVKRPDYKVAIRTGEKNAVVVLDVFRGKEYVEIVGWRMVNEKGLAKMQRQAEREGGQFLILSPNDGSAAALSALPSGSSSAAESTTPVSNEQENEQKSDEISESEGEKDVIDELREQNRVADERDRRAGIPPRPSDYSAALSSGDTEAQKAWENKWNDYLSKTVSDDIPTIESTIRRMQDLKSTIEAGNPKGYKDNPNYKAFDHVEKALKKRKRELEQSSIIEDKSQEVEDKSTNDGDVSTLSQESEQVSDQVSDAPYTIAPAQYTTKKGEVLDMYLVKFVGTLTKEKQRAAEELVKADNGWYDREQDGFMMRSEESAEQLADTIISDEKAVSDAGQAAELQQGALTLDRENTAFEAATEQTMQALKNTGVEVVMATPEMVQAVMGTANAERQMISDANERFNRELQQQIDGTLPKGHIYKLGMPSAVLQSAGLPYLPIELASSRLSDKSMQENHPFELSEVEGLVEGVQNPLAVFRSATHVGSFVMLTEIQHEGKNYVVAIEANRRQGRIEINSVRSIHYRNSNTHIANWIEEGLLEYADKKRMPEWFSKQQYNSADVRNLFRHSAKIVESFENPKVSAEFHRVYHGSGAKFDRFNHSFMGTCEGAQVYGWGTYVTEVKGIGRAYATTMRDKVISEKHRENAIINDLARQTLASNNGDKNAALEYLYSLLNEDWSDKKRVKAQIKIIETGKFLPETKVKAHLYTVEIPDDNGSNYLHWEKPVSDNAKGLLYAQIRKEGAGKFDFADQKFWAGKSVAFESGELLYDRLSYALGSDKAASEFLSRAGFVGISFPAQFRTGGRADGARNYVIFNENDARITDHVAFLRTPDGTVYGWTVGGRIYLTPAGVNPNTPVHEYTHLWASTIEKSDPKLWASIVRGMKQSPVWNEIGADEAYRDIWNDDNRMASEVLSRLTGEENYRRAMERAEAEIKSAPNPTEAAKKITMWERVKRALSDFWNKVKAMFDQPVTGNPKSDEPEWMEFVNSAIGDFYKGVNPNVENPAVEFAKRESERRKEKNRINSILDEAGGFFTIGGKRQAAKNRLKREAERKQLAEEIYTAVLKGDFNDVTLERINKYIEDATPNNPFGRRISQRLPQRMERSLHQGARTNAVDALFSRICESAVPANERFSEAGRREIEERKKELLKGWAIATGNWHTDLKEFTDDTEPIGEGKDSKVYMSKDGNSVIKASKGKPPGKKFRPDIDNIPLFNDVFKNSRYEILGYGEIDGEFVRILKQDFVDFAESTPLTPKERTEYMSKLGFEPLNKDNTAFSNGEIVIADLQKSNIVKDAAGNISVIDADAKLHTKDVGGSYTYPAVETDLPGKPEFMFIGELGAANLDKAQEATTRLDNLAVAREMEQRFAEKNRRIEKLKASTPIEITGNEIEPSEDLKQYKHNALEYGKSLRGEYTNADTGAKIAIGKSGIKEVLNHDYKNVEQLQSVAAIPQIIEQSTYIDSVENEDTSKNKEVSRYHYYVCGLKIGGVDYTVRAVIAEQPNGERYYDHKLTQIEKGTLLDSLSGITTPGFNQETSPVSAIKDKRLISILQTNDKENARRIKLATGWERSADGKWRYEVEDAKVKDTINIDGNEFKRREEDMLWTSGLLKNVIDAPGLFEAYPELENVRLDADPITEDYPSNGEYDPRRNMITIHADEVKYLNSILNHEIQHAIQHIEGFAQGGNTKTIDVIQGKARVWAWRNALKETEQEYPELAGTTALEQKLIDEYKTEGLESYIPAEEQRIKGFNLYVRGYDNEGYEQAFNQVAKVISGNGFATYKRIAGEVESRNVQERMGMTEEERRNSLAEETEDVAREDQIFIYDGLASAMMGSRVDARMAEVASYFDGKPLTEQQQAVVDVFGGKADNVKLAAGDNTVVMRQGNEMGAGTKHALFRHYGMNNGSITADDILLIPEIIANGERTEKKRGKTTVIEYKYTDNNGVEYTVLTEVDSRREAFANFYTNRKTSSAARKTRSEEARDTADDAFADKGNNNSSTSQEAGDIRYRSIGGNSGYVGYSMSKRAAEAREEGRFPKTDFKKEYNMPGRTLDALVAAGIIDNGEWHHTSKFGNKTVFYGWADDAYADFYAEHKAEVDAMAKGENIDGSLFVAEVEENPYTEQKYVVPMEYSQQRRSLENEGMAYDRIDEILKERFPELYAASENNRRFHEFESEISSARYENEKIISNRLTALFDEDRDGVMFRGDDSIEAANERFNRELDAFKEKRHKGLLHLGRPGAVLSAAGVNAEELTLSPSVLFQHLKKHNLTTEDLKGLAEAVQSPILVYRHGETRPHLVVVTELEAQGGKLSVALRLDENGNVVEVSNVSSVHSKDAATELDRLSILGEEKLQDYLRWVEKEKVSDWLGLPYEEERQDADPKLISVANVIENFENPSIEEEFLNEEDVMRSLQRDEADREITDAVTSLAARLNTEVEIITSTGEITDDDAERLQRKRASKGWYEPKSGKVVIVLPNNFSVQDAVETVLHEVVGHDGLRRVFGRGFDRFLDDVFMTGSTDTCFGAVFYTIKMIKKVCNFSYYEKYILHLQCGKKKGALAHLARAFDWQSKGDEFESRMLHQKRIYVILA